MYTHTYVKIPAGTHTHVCMHTNQEISFISVTFRFTPKSFSVRKQAKTDNQTESVPKVNISKF